MFYSQNYEKRYFIEFYKFNFLNSKYNLTELFQKIVPNEINL